LSDDLLRVEEGSLYPALQRLELNGWIEGEWGLSANNRRARFYKLTPDGRKHLAAESARYRQVTGAVARIMKFASAFGLSLPIDALLIGRQSF
jgi:PadR family transcriptional regulator PadR